MLFYANCQPRPYTNGARGREDTRVGATPSRLPTASVNRSISICTVQFPIHTHSFSFIYSKSKIFLAFTIEHSKLDFCSKIQQITVVVVVVFTSHSTLPSYWINTQKCSKVLRCTRTSRQAPVVMHGCWRDWKLSFAKRRRRSSSSKKKSKCGCSGVVLEVWEREWKTQKKNDDKMLYRGEKSLSGSLYGSEGWRRKKQKSWNGIENMFFQDIRNFSTTHFFLSSAAMWSNSVFFLLQLVQLNFPSVNSIRRNFTKS